MDPSIWRRQAPELPGTSPELVVQTRVNDVAVVPGMATQGGEFGLEGNWIRILIRYRPRRAAEVVVEILDLHRPIRPIVRQGIFEATAGSPADPSAS